MNRLGAGLKAVNASTIVDGVKLPARVWENMDIAK
jgi:hypothetical protein